MGDQKPIVLCIVEDDRGTREGLRALIAGTPGYRCAAAFGSVEEALDFVPEVPDVVLLDIHLPGMTGTTAVPHLKKKWPAARVLMLTAFTDEEKVFESICNGADGYLLKRTPPAKLLEAIRDGFHEGSSMSPEIARKVIDLYRRVAPPPRAEHDLAAQEVRVLRLLAEGHSYQAMGDRMNVSINTIRNYIRSIYEKLHVHSRSEAVSKALRSRIL
jgi:DNA-binding NarL/FixJ family response regulator